MKRKVQIGHVGVDSGQIMICDPCYVDSQWRKEDFHGESRYRHQGTGELLTWPKDFGRYDEVLPTYGKSMNDMISKGEMKELPPIPAKNAFSYNGCCIKSSGEEGYGQISDGTAVVSRSGYGDGDYPVYATLDSNGRVEKIEILFT